MRHLIFCGVAVSLAGVGSAQSAFVEDFEGGLAGWSSAGTLSPVLNTEGGNSFVSVTSPVEAAGGMGFGAFTLLSGLASNGASGGAFTGNYLASGITSLSFDVRHNADQDLTFSLRVADALNFPSFIVFSPVEVAAGSEFTTVSYSFEEGNPFFFPGLDPFAVLPNVGNIQLLADNPAFAEADDVTFDFDNIALVPAPGAAALFGVLGLIAPRRR